MVMSLCPKASSTCKSDFYEIDSNTGNGFYNFMGSLSANLLIIGISICMISER